MRSIKLLKPKGFSLVEVLVAMLVSSIILLAIVRLFGRLGDMYDENSASMQLMETTRIAMKFIRGDLVQTGYLGCIMTDIEDVAELEASLSATLLGSNIDNNMLGIWGTDGGGNNPDVLSVFYQQDLDIRVLYTDTTPSFTPNPSFMVDSSNVFNDNGDPLIVTGDWLVASNCYNSTVFMLTNTPTAISEATYPNIKTGITAEGSLSLLEYSSSVNIDGYSNRNDESIKKANLGLNAGGGAAMISRFLQVTYSLGPSEIDGGETQSLYRLVNGEARSEDNEMIRLVEDFQVEYGVDEDFDGVVDRFVSTFNSQSDRIVMVKVLVEISDGTRTEDLENVVKLRNKGL